jgi:tRNA1Val (adenine37-N6)-methyltransferase
MSDFHFKRFSIHQSRSALKVGTDAMILGALIESSGKQKALDIGTGTGVLAMMVAQTNPSLNITAIEIDSDSFEDAKCNFRNGPFSDRLMIRNEDFTESSFTDQFDLIFSNPPFYTDTLKTTSARTNVAKHSGTLNPEILCSKVQDVLSDFGDFWLIWPFQSREEFIKAANSNNLFLKQDITLEGKPGKPVRSVFCFSKKKSEKEKCRSLVIRNESGGYSDEYKVLTVEFHGKNV